MSQGTKIEWADDTINFAGGCSEARLAGGKMDPACVHCYARLMSVRSDGMMAALGKESIYEDVAERGEGNTARWTGVLRWDRELMRKRFARMRGGRRVFPGSMTDLWHEGHNPGLLVALAEEIRAIGERPPHKRPSIITLTKREQRLLAWQREHFPEGLPEWVWPGVTAGCQEAADQRVPVLLQVRAEGPRVVSVEPMTGPVNLTRVMEHGTRYVSVIDSLSGVHGTAGGTFTGARLGWVIVGGESGQKARPMHPDWVGKLRDQCVAAGVPFLFKQWGEWAPRLVGDMVATEADTNGRWKEYDGKRWMEPATNRAMWSMFEVGKKAAGRELDGRTWDEIPSVAS